MRRWALGIGGRGGSRWAALAIAMALLGLGLWAVWPSGDPRVVPARAPAKTDRALAQDPADPDRAHADPDEPGTRPVIVDVVGCQRRPARDVLVLAQLGRLQLSARTDESGQARIAVPLTSGEALVRVRLPSRETTPIPATGDRAEVSACPGATVSGRVIDEEGQPLSGVAVRIADAQQAALDEIEVEADGHFELSDAMLDGVQLAVETPAGLEVRPLAPLTPGEARTVDIIVGRVHEVVGWVLDMNGDPQPGVAVTMRAQNFASTWFTATDAKGAFRFAYAPVAPVRVDADGGDLGKASARLAGSSARREVSLTLEPVGEITVLASDADGKSIEGTAIVRCTADSYHGEDPLYTDSLDPIVLPPVEIDGAANPPDGATSEEPKHEPDVATVMQALETGLRDFDPSTPNESMKRLVRSMLQQVPDLAHELPPEIRQSATFDEAVDALTEQALRENPGVVDEIARAADYVQNGATLEDAMRMAASSEGPDMPQPATSGPAQAEPANDGTPGAPIEGPGDTPNEGSEEGVDEGGDGVVNDDGMGSGVGDESPMGVEAATDEPIVDEMPTTEAAPSDWYAADTDERAVVARGPLAEAISLRGSFQYAVSVRRADGMERYCGTVFLHPGESLTVSCGIPSEARIAGRVIDSRGTPIPHLTITAYVDNEAGTPVTAESDAHGRFELKTTVDRGQMTSLEVSDPTVRLAVSTRRNVMVLPGELQDLGDIVVRTPDEVPEGLMSKPFGGIGGYISLTDNGVYLDNIEPETPLALEGAEPGDEIVMIDGVSAAELSMDDVLERLRGEPGTDVALRIRSKAGELYELDVTRGTIKPHVEADQAAAPEPSPPIY